jgi:hypothetical protein
MRRYLVAPIACLFALGLVSRGLAAPPPDAGEPVPKALPRAPKDAKNGAGLPAFLGFFGPAALLEKTGFRSSPGRWISFDLSQAGASMRLQEVAGGPPGARWVELLAESGGTSHSGVKILARGLSDGNVERLVASLPGYPSLEFPLDSGSVAVGEGEEDGPVPTGPLDTGAFAFGKPRLAGRESVTVPLGTFACDHWVVELPGKKARMDVWTTKDDHVPFNGAVKMISPTGTALARRVGTDAAARIAVPSQRR